MNKNRSSEKTNSFPIGRRNFIATTVAGLAVTTLAAPLNLFFTPTSKIKAIAFDAFAIFDPQLVLVLVESRYPEKGKELSDVWRTKQFEYSWLRATANQYKNFWEVTEDALIYAAKK